MAEQRTRTYSFLSCMKSAHRADRDAFALVRRRVASAAGVQIAFP